MAGAEMCEDPVKSVLSFSHIFFFSPTMNDNTAKKQTPHTESTDGLSMEWDFLRKAELLPPRQALNQIPSPINST